MTEPLKTDIQNQIFWRVLIYFYTLFYPDVLGSEVEVQAGRLSERLSGPSTRGIGNRVQKVRSICSLSRPVPHSRGRSLSPTERPASHHS